MLRTHAVIDRSNERPGPAAQVTGNEIMSVEAANDVASAMVVNNHRHRHQLLRPIKAQEDLAGGTGDHALLDTRNGKRLGLARPRGGFHLLTRLCRRHLFDRPKPRLGHQPQDFLDLWMKARHGFPDYSAALSGAQTWSDPMGIATLSKGYRILILEAAQLATRNDMTIYSLALFLPRSSLY